MEGRQEHEVISLTVVPGALRGKPEQFLPQKISTITLGQDIGGTVFTVAEVPKEIKDQKTRERLQVLPYDLVTRVPSPAAVKLVSDFAKKTGDYWVLSAVDIKLLALTFDLEKEWVGVSHIKQVPDSKKEVCVSSRGIGNLSDVAGFYVPKAKKLEDSQNAVVVKTEDLQEDEDDQECANDEDAAEDPTESPEGQIVEEDEEHLDSDKGDGVEEGLEHAEENDGGDGDCDDEDGGGGEDDGGDDEEGDRGNEQEEGDDDDEGWITPSNIKEVTKGKPGDVEKANVMVGCLTTDFAMQNVLIQMGLNVISVDGMLIKRARTYAKRCFSCMKIITDMSRLFCPFCGYKTLHRITMTVADDGTIQYSMPKRIVRTKLRVPYTFKGGKYSSNPILSEDQPMPEQRLSKKALRKMNVMDDDFMACSNSPFAMRDTHSRATKMGLSKNRWNKRNPNVVKKGKKK